MSQAWRAFVPDQVLELVRDDGELPLARPVRQTAAVLFADIAGFTGLSESLCAPGRRGAEKLNRLLNRYYGHLIDDVDRYGGSVVRFAGDALVAVFPYSGTGVLETRRAVRCALDMQAATGAFVDSGPGTEPVRLAMKAGLARGTVVGAVFGDPSIRVEYVVSGRPLDLATAAEHVAAPGEVLVDQELPDTDPAIRTETGRSSTRVVRGLSAEVHPVPVTRPATPPDDVAARFAPFLHRPVAERLRAGQTGLVDEHRKVSVAFVALPAWAPDRTWDHAQSVIAEAVRTIDRHGGHFLQVDTGDKGNVLVVCFGAPITHENDEERAVRCCLDLLARHDGAVRAGVTTAFVFCGEVGSARRREYLLMGDSVNLAARLMQAAEPGQLLVDDRTRGAVRTLATARELPPVRVKGKTAPVVVHAVNRIAEPVRPIRVSGPLIGRHVEHARLAELAARAFAGQGQVVAVTGDAGAGKSRLVGEIDQIAARFGATTHRGAADDRETRTGYLVWRPVWDSLLSTADRRSVSARRARVREYVARLDGGSAQRAPLLAPVLGTPMPDNELTAGLDGPTRAEFLHTLLADSLRERVVSGPVMIVLEDCQWIDQPSAALLVALARTVSDLPVLLVLTSRKPLTGTAPLTRAAHVSELALAELPAADAERLVRSRLQGLVGDTELPAGLIDTLVSRGAGNPFFLEELASLVHTRGVDTDAAGDDLPDTLHSLLLARLDRLDEAEQATIKVASVLGSIFPASCVQGAYPALGDADTVLGHLERLERLDLTRLHTAGADPKYTFRHGLVQEVAYNTLSFATRADLHEAVGTFLERTCAANIADHVQTIAHHYGRSANTAKQLVWFRAAGDAARSAFANDAAIGHYQRLLALLPDDQAGQVLVHLGALWHLTGQWTEADGAYRRAIEAGEAAGDLEVVAQSRRDLGVLCTYRRNYSDAVSWLTEAGSEFEQLGDRLGIASTLDRLSFAYFQQGRYAEALVVAERHLALATAISDQNGRSAALENMGLIHGHTSDHVRAIEFLSQALRIAEEAGNDRAVSYAANDLAGVYLRRGDHVQAMAHLERARQAAERIGFRSLAAVLIGNAGELYREHGDHTRALGCFSHALMTALDLGDWTSLLGQLGNLGLTCAAQSRFDIADRLLERAVRIARALTAPYLLCEFLYWLAKLRAEHGGEYVDQLNAEALEIADRIDHRHHRLHCRLLAIRVGPVAEAGNQLHALLAQWSEPADRAAIHTELWRHTGDATARTKATTVMMDLYRRAPTEELREGLAFLTNEPLPACPALPPLPPEVIDPDLDVDTVLNRVDFERIDQLAGQEFTQI